MEELHSCGYEEDSFACKIRHLTIGTGVANAAKDSADAAQERKYGI